MLSIGQHAEGSEGQKTGLGGHAAVAVLFLRPGFSSGSAAQAWPKERGLDNEVACQLHAEVDMILQPFPFCHVWPLRKLFVYVKA